MGTYYLENIYKVNGIGQSLMTAVNGKEASLLLGIIIISALLSILSYLLGDVVTAMVDPRISFSK
jgi:ABC-type dipeptide/oligopeptide/nickel transport system permease component